MEMRSLGDGYVKSGLFISSEDFSLTCNVGVILEFRRHKEITNPWDGDAANFSGKKLDPTVFERVSELLYFLALS